MFPVTNPAQITRADPGGGTSPPPNVPKAKEVKESECYLTSIRDLRATVVKNKHTRKYFPE